MHKIYKNLKTSDKISFLFTLFNFISLIILLIGINIIYFFAWYTDQKRESMYDMNMNYNIYNSGKSQSNIEAFKEYILQKDTLIIPKNGGELICSNGVETKIHNNIDKIKDKLFYNNGEKIFFIFTQYYDEIGEVKIFFDTTTYVKSQILIIKISLFIILLIIVIYYLLGKVMTAKAFRNMKQFITDVSHEFKTPLMVINSQIDLYNKKLEKGKLSKNDTELLLSKIKEKTAKLNNLLETFLLLSRLDTSMQCLNKQEVNLDKYLENITCNLILSYKKRIKINYNLNKKIRLKIEENTFNILFENLFSNAIKFSDEGGNIEIGSNKNSFWIKDNGEGIKKEKLKNIWNKFYRGDINKQGFGVGLFIVKRLCDLYGWNVYVESEFGKGSKFIIKFK